MGPDRVLAATARWTVAHRFARAGTYRIVASLPAPGMRMTVRVLG